MVLIPLSRSELRAVLAPIEAARGLPPRAFTEVGVFAWELDALFAPGFFAASAADASTPGQWVRAPLGSDRLVVACDGSLERALLRDVCRHRGMPLLDGDEGELAALSMRCPYHGWRYALDGALVEAPGACVGERGALGVRAGGVAVDGVVLRASQRAAPRGVLSRVPWLDARLFAVIRRARRVRWDVSANWKLLVENFQEAHHFSAVHPWLEALTPWDRSHSVVSGDGWLGGVMALREGIETVSTSGRLRGRRRIVEAGMEGCVRDAWIAPNLFTSLQPDYLLTYRLHPLRADLTRVFAEVWVHAETRDDDGVDEVYALWDRVNAEDRAICEAQQRALGALREAGVYCASEDGTHAFDRWIAAAMLDAMGET